MPLPPRAQIFGDVTAVISNLSGNIEALDALIARLPLGALRTALTNQRGNLQAVLTALDNMLP